MIFKPDLVRLIVITVISLVFCFGYWIEENEKDLKWYGKLLDKIFGGVKKSSKSVDTDLQDRE